MGRLSTSSQFPAATHTKHKLAPEGLSQHQLAQFKELTHAFAHRCEYESKHSVTEVTLEYLRLLLPEVAPKVGNDILVCAFLHHEDFLLDDGKVVPWKESEKKKTDMEGKRKNF